MQNLNKVFFLAAGLGTRLKPYTDRIAKPAIPFWGLPQMLYPFYFTQQLNISQWAYNSHHNAETLKLALQSFGLHNGVEFFESQLLDSAGGIFNARSFLETEEHFMALNADSLFVYPDLIQIQKEIEAHTQENRLATLFTIPKDGAGVVFSGLHSDSKHQLRGAGLLNANNPNLTCTHFIGISVFSKRIFKYLSSEPKNIIHDYLVPLSQKEPVQVCTLKDWDWFELGKTQDFKESYKTVSHHLKSGRYALDSYSSFYQTQRFFDPKWSHTSFQPTGIEKEILDQTS